MNRPRTMIIGLDGATFDIIEPLVRAGHLPVMAGLMDRGIHGPLQVWPNMNSAAAWSSMITGYNPGRHGIYDFGDALPQRGSEWHPTTAADRKKDPFWRLLSRAGQRVGIINVPITYPADKINGFMLAGMDTPAAGSRGFAHPPDLLDELGSQKINYIIDVPNLGGFRRRDPHRVPPPVERMVEARSRAILHLMASRPCDLLMAVFVATDRMQHHFWPDERASVDDPTWTPLRSVYRQIDRFLGEALSIAGEQVSVLLVSDHGFGPVRPATHLLNHLFAQLGLLCYRSDGISFRSRVSSNLKVYGRKIVPLSLQRPLALAFPKLRLRTLGEAAFAGIDWLQTSVFADPQGDKVTINLRGRQPEGIVPPDEYRCFRDRIRHILSDLTDTITGRRVIRAVHKREDVYHGPYMEKAADLLIEWDYEAARDSLSYASGEGPVVVKPLKEPRSRWKANHRPQGIFIASGPHIKRGMKLDGANIYDVAPTALYLQGHPVPKDMDGKVLADIFTEQQLRRYPIVECEPANADAQTITAQLDRDEEREIEERLRGMGYLE